MKELLRELNGYFPRNQNEYDAFIHRLKQHYHFIQHFPGSINDALHPRRSHARHYRRGYLADVQEQGDEQTEAFLGLEDQQYRQPTEEHPPWYYSGDSSDAIASGWSHPDDPESSYVTDSSAGDDDLISATDTETESSLNEFEYNWDDIAHLSP